MGNADGLLGQGESTLARALESGNVPSLLAALVHLTGDTCWVGERYRTSPGRGISEHNGGGLPEEVQSEVRRAAAEAIIAWRRGRPMAIGRPDSELLARMARVVLGEEVPPEYLDMAAQELSVLASPPPPARVGDGIEAVIVGAGVSGIAAAVRLGEAGVDCTVLERNPALGGTWFHNSYPGCGVDTPSHLYEYSFAPHDWPRYFARGAEVREYLETVVADYRVTERIRFETEVLRAAYDEEAQRWVVTTRRPDGSIEELRSKLLVSAVGALSTPKLPSIPGMETFAGRAFHSARWPVGFGIEGLRVAVVGTGATAMQVVPAIAGLAASVQVFQRAAQWAAPFELFGQSIPDGLRALLAEVVPYRIWYRIRLAWTFNDSTYAALVVDPEWPHQDRSVSAANDRQRETLTRYIINELGEHCDMIPKVLPDYPPFGKRMLLDNGWFRTVTLPEVELETTSIKCIEPRGIVTVDGTLHEVDVIVYATGFDALCFLSSIDVHGRGGVSLRDLWGDSDARAYLGLTVPGFPNFFCLYGPNLQPGHGGSLIFSIECQIDLIVELLVRAADAGGLGAVECTEEAFDRYNAKVDARHQHMIWSHPRLRTYYRNSRGRVVVNTPFRVVDYWQMTRSPEVGAYAFELPRDASHAAEDSDASTLVQGEVG